DRYFSGENPLGRRVRLGASESERPWVTIVGVVPDMYVDGPSNEDPQGLYRPLAQMPDEFVGIAIRATGDPLELTTMVRDEVAAIDGNLPIYFIDTLDSWIRQNTWFVRVFGALFMIFGAVALFLASVGLYGVMSFSVGQRIKEVGVRMALGAEGHDVLKLVLRQGLIQLTVGVILGLGLGALLSKGLEVALFNVQPFDPLIFGAIIVILIGTGMIASFVPARRATKVDPMIALRYE
ncbi:MAG: FtsX-like permease family protein, partial [Gemmatimonadetes bacterium]|nr:FtsX-like permease family protein [Gemmatimonadota bacterium]NIR75992.1 FtsX-like permease family protein [Candidatus Kutchimonas denitrificans]NIS02184.1 FtsX-like permease family protein [Gemmatimonadota bacterium]NIT68010.1 FtsX-like permease family protein [Gemmatimonadota bacterium]NIU54036.1 FtsX-like permease family protein [Gemmatimonadota bacterium]